jgi:hypothetical protein
MQPLTRLRCRCAEFLSYALHRAGRVSSGRQPAVEGVSFLRHFGLSTCPVRPFDNLPESNRHLTTEKG